MSGIGMADFQFLPDPNDPVSQLRTAMDNLDGMYRLDLAFLD